MIVVCFGFEQERFFFYRTESNLIEGRKVKGQVGANFVHEFMATREFTERQNRSVECE